MLPFVNRLIVCRSSTTNVRQLSTTFHQTFSVHWKTISKENKMFPSSSRFHSQFSNQKQYDIQYIEEIRKEFSAEPLGDLKLEMNHSTGVAMLCIDNLKYKNCFSGFMMAKLTEIIDQLEQWTEGKAVIIYGEQGFFCSGGDLNTVRKILNREGGRKMITLMQYNLDRLQSLPLITLAYVRGMSIGGGCELMTACDYRLATPEAKLGFVQMRIGIPTVWGGGARLVQLIGYNKAVNLIATGRTLTANEAEKIGFIDKVVDNVTNDGQTEKEMILKDTMEFLNPFLQHPRHTMLLAKEICNDARFFTTNLNKALYKELEHGLKIWGGPVHKKALNGKVNHKKN